MQDVAAEMNLSETAFVVRNEHAPFGLRWFTPNTEVILCGHATIASSHALWQAGWATESEAIQYQTLSGLLIAERIGDLIQLDFPRRHAKPIEAPQSLLESLGVKNAEFIGNDIEDILVQVDSEATLLNLTPDYQGLQQLDGRGVIVTAKSENPAYDFVSRCFFPNCGIDEDPVTGSAHCSLADFWTTRLGKNVMTGFQASSRGGIVHIEVCDERVKLRGHAVTVVSGSLLA
jgi:PhzF family phenazine biosynthesis protein